MHERVSGVLDLQSTGENVELWRGLAAALTACFASKEEVS